MKTKIAPAKKTKPKSDSKNSGKQKDKVLVIVESPTKAKTLTKYLNSKYKILASMGHIIDLPKSRIAVNVDDDFRPDYITVRGRAKILNQLKKEAKKADTVLLASDPDREGEAISYHLMNVLKTFNSKVYRIEFNEITKEAIEEALKSPRPINMNLFYAQQARRILDRLVGYNISPILWKKVKKGLSAGRVQSVALREVCDREEKIQNFIAEEYWNLDVYLNKDTRSIIASLAKINGDKAWISHEKEIQDIIAKLAQGEYKVVDVKKTERKRNPLPPYTTAKLQQDAATRLGFSSFKTMIVAQQLYEGVELKKEGSTGLISYMRTDSVRISKGAQDKVRQYITDTFSKEFLPTEANFYATGKSAQDAHEAIRPSDPYRTPVSIKESLSKEQFKLYELIWSKFVASQMTPERSLQTSIQINNQEFEFKAIGKKVLFKGFTEIMGEIVSTDEGKEKKEKDKKLPDFQINEILNLSQLEPSQHFTSPPPRYNDASIVKRLEESGVGRPSTYAPTIMTLLKRYYVLREKRQLVPTELGKLVNKIMVANFASLVNLGFTADMELKLDSIEEGSTVWVEMLKKFYTPFIETVENASKNIAEMRSVLDEETDLTCEKCGRKMVKKIGRYGYFLACSGFPECSNAKPIPIGDCPLDDCNGSIIKRSTKKGRPFYGCTNYPKCEFSTWDTPQKDSKCPECQSTLFEKNSGRNRNGKESPLFCLKPSCKLNKANLGD